MKVNNRFIPIKLIGLVATGAFLCGGVNAAPTLDGHPDFTGVWDFVPLTFGYKSDGINICVGGCDEIQNATVDVGRDFSNATRGRPNYQLEYQDKVADLTERQTEEDSMLRCRPPGVPRLGAPDQIIQKLGMIVFLYEDPVGGFFRVIPLDGRGYRDDYDVGYLGDSIGYWEGDTLVVETTKIDTETWLTDNGAFHTDNLRVVEKLTYEGEQIQYESISYDPEVLVEPWVQNPRILTRTEKALWEPAPCIDDMSYQIDDTYHGNPR